MGSSMKEHVGSWPGLFTVVVFGCFLVVKSFMSMIQYKHK